MTTRFEGPSRDAIIGRHEREIRALAWRPRDDNYIYVGTVGLDGVDAFLTADSPPFENGWTNTLGGKCPFRFRRHFGGGQHWLTVEGSVTGGADGTVVTTLPVVYRPDFDLVLPASDDAGLFVVFYVAAAGPVYRGMP